MTTLFLAFRNIERQKKRSILLGGAIAFGIMIITLINSVAVGSVENVKENFSQLLAGHIYIQGKELTESGRTLKIIRDDTLLNSLTADLGDDVQYITKRSYAFCTLIFGSKELMQSIEGVDWTDESYFGRRLIITKGSLDGLENPNAIVLSTETAEKLGVQAGEALLVKLQTVTGQQNVGECKVIALTQGSDMFGSISAYTHIEFLNRLINLKEGEFQMYNIFLKDMGKIDRSAEQLYKALSEAAPVVPRDDTRGEDEAGQQMHSMFGMMSGSKEEESWEGTKYELVTLNDMMSHVMALVDVLNTVIYAIFLILLVIIMVGITNTFRMILVERTREIGTIRAIGMQKNGVRGLFLTEAFYIALFGAFAGLVIASGIAGILSIIPFSTNNPFFIFLNNGKLTFRFMPVSIIINILVIAGTSVLAALFPAQKAAKLDPAKALGTHY
ncbi:MAG: ABC transporter permease [Spirochaetales bacterium]|nr:ABC transporter permease [Spirochaetales bacterium]